VATLSDFEAARQERLWDGISLWCDGRPQGGIYLVGYHAEITLKAAYFRQRGFLSHQTIDDPHQRELVKTTARGLGVITPPESLHSLRFWRDLLIRDRIRAGTPLPPQIEIELTSHVDTLYSLWKVEMRYASPIHNIRHLETAMVAANWLDLNYQALYV
jgi:hypothetical protein